MLQKETPVRILPASRIPETDAVFILNVNMPVLANFLTEISHKWEILAVSLKIPKHVIEECRGSSNAVSLCNILDKWVSGSGYIPATLQCLDDVLSSKLIGECSLAGKLVNYLEKTAKFDPVISPQEPADLACFLTLVYQSGDIEVADGQSTLMEVQVNANGSVSFLWKKSNMTLNDDIQYSGTKTNILFIKQANQGVQGKYFCNMKNECGEIQSGVMNLSVKHSFKKKRLLNLYCKRDEVPRPPWPLVGMKSFINLALISPEDNAPHYNYVVEEDVDKYLEATTEINHVDIFGKCESGSLVWIIGRPGSGKTTLLHKLTKDWTIQSNVLKLFQDGFLYFSSYF